MSSVPTKPARKALASLGLTASPTGSRARGGQEVSRGQCSPHATLAAREINGLEARPASRACKGGDDRVELSLRDAGSAVRSQAVVLRGALLVPVVARPGGHVGD